MGVRVLQDCLFQGKVTPDYMRTQWIASSSVSVVGMLHHFCRNVTKNMGSLTCAKYFLVTYSTSFVDVETLVTTTHPAIQSVGMSFSQGI